MTEDNLPEGDARIEAFWNHAMLQARINPFEVVTGPSRDSTLVPPTWLLDNDTVEKALADKVLVLTSPAGQHEERLEAGGFSILTREDGNPVALLQTTQVTTHTVEEMEVLEERGDWETVRETVAPDAQVVVEKFRVLYHD